VAGRIPQHFIDELIARTDIVELIGSRVQLKRAGREYKACCPFHDEKTPSFTVSPDKQFYHCFGCGAHGTALGFIMEYDHLGFVEAVEDLASRAGLDVPREGGTGAAPQPNEELYAGLERASLYFRQCLSGEPRARAYLDRRGIGAEAAQQFAIGYAPPGWDGLLQRLGSTAEERQVLQRAGLIVERQGDSSRVREDAGFYDRFRDRIMFPIRDVRGRAIGFGGRVLDSGEPKYLNSPETELFHKGRELYGLFEARQATRKLERILVVEGYMDVVSLHQAGITYAVATLGTATTPEHLQRVFRLVGEVVFCFDGDRAGRAAAWRALENAVGELKQGRQVRFLFLPDGEDPDSLVRAEGREAFEGRIAQAIPLSQYLIQELGTRSDTGSVDGRARLVELARPLLARIPSDVYRELLVSELAEVVGISGPRLLELLSAAGSPGETDRPAAPRPVRSRGPAAPFGRGNLVRQAITLLVHYPSAAATLQEAPAIDGIERPGIALLAELLHQLREDPAPSTAALLERWRPRPEYGPLSRLASAECLVSDAAAAASELASAIARLTEEEQPAQRLDYLLGRARDNALTEQEKQELKSLLQAKGQSAQRQPTK
jgi:DNA primase